MLTFQLNDELLPLCVSVALARLAAAVVSTTDVPVRRNSRDECDLTVTRSASEEIDVFPRLRFGLGSRQKIIYQP